MCKAELAMQVPIWLTALLTLASGLLTFTISTWFYIRHEERKQKLEVFRGLMATRHGLEANPDTETKNEFFKFLNESFVVFGKSPEVIESVRDFKTHPNRAPDNFTLLARAICKDLKIPDSTLQDNFFNEPFIPRF